MDADLCRVTTGGISWLTIAADRACVDEVAEALQSGGELLRATPHRRVLRVGVSRPLIVKHFSPRGVTAKLKTFMRRSGAAREWRALRKAIRLELPVPRPVAVGWRRKGLRRESFLVTEALDHGLSMSACLFGKHRLEALRRREVTRAAARAIRRMHDAGIFHKDLHLDNLIVSNGAACAPVYLIDFQRVAFHRWLSPRLRMRNLAILNGGCIEAGRTDRLRFLKAYFSGDPRSNGDWRSLAARLDEMGKRHRRRILRSRRRRCLAENREFKKVRLGKFVGVVRRDRQDHFAARWRCPAQCFSRATIVTSSDERTLGRIDFADRAVYIAHYRKFVLARSIISLFVFSAARRAWLAGNSGVMWGVAMGTPLAWLERRRWPLLLDSYVISESKEGADLLETLVCCARNFRVKRRLIHDFARYVARLHDCDMGIRRLTGNEVIVSRRNSSFVFSLVDFSGLTRGPLSRRSRVRHLYALAGTVRHNGVISKTDRLRFLRAYLGKDFQSEWKTFGRGLRAQWI
jgi:tRNA A-37 threonylcarbamoyl transferase component Bud32